MMEIEVERRAVSYRPVRSFVLHPAAFLLLFCPLLKITAQTFPPKNTF